MTTPTSEDQVRALVVAAAQGEVGKHYGVGAWTPYGAWYGPGWGNALFCAAGWSWCWDKALGTDTARQIIGYQRHGGQAPYQRGFVWTVAIYEQHRTHHVPLRSLKPGDGILFKYPTVGDRNTNVVNHIDLVEVNRPDLGYADCIGFNVARPGAPAGTDQSRGGGVWRRRIWYSNPYVVTGVSMPVASLTSVYRREWGRVQLILTDLGLAQLQGTGTVGPATRAGLQAYARTYGYTGPMDDHEPLLEHMEALMSNILDRLAALEARLGVTPPKPKPVPEPTAPSWRRSTVDLNIRSGPSTAYPVVGMVPGGERYRISLVDGKPVTSNGWVRGRSDAMRDAGASAGWVNGSYLKEW